MLTHPRGPRAPGTTVTTGAPTTTRLMARAAAAETTGPTMRRPLRDTRARPGLPGPRARPVRRLPGTAGDSPTVTTRPTDWPGPAGRAPGKACTKPTARRTTTTGAKPGRGGTCARPAPPRTPRTRPTGRSRARPRGHLAATCPAHGGGPGEDLPDAPGLWRESPGPGHARVSHKDPRRPLLSPGPPRWGPSGTDKPHSQGIRINSAIFGEPWGKWRLKKKNF